MNGRVATKLKRLAKKITGGTVPTQYVKNSVSNAIEIQYESTRAVYRDLKKGYKDSNKK